MKTKRLISKLRAVTEVAAQMVFVLLLVLLLVGNYPDVQNLLLRFWPIGAGILLVYAVLSVTEDYLNSRILYKYLQFT